MTTQSQESKEKQGNDLNKGASDLTPEQQDAADEAAFETGFNGDEGETQPEKKPEGGEGGDGEPKGSTDTNSAGEQGAPAPGAGADDDKPVLAGLTEPQIKSLLAEVGELKEYRTKTEKTLQQVFGKFGDIQRQITATQGGVLTKREINAQALKRLGKEFPDIAEMLAGDLSEVLAGLPPAGQGMDQAKIDEHVNRVVAERVDAAVEALQQEMLTNTHKDWEDIAKSDDLKLWLTTQTPEYREKFMSSKQASFISDGLTKFKAWRDQGKNARQRNQQRLENAIPAKGGSVRPAGPAVLSDEAAFEVGFNSVRRG